MVKKEKPENDLVETREERRARRAEWREYRHHSNPIGAILLIFLGIIFLLNNTGVVPWSIWSYIWQFWPVLIILLGIRILLGRSYGANLIIGILAVIILGAVLANALRLTGAPLFDQLGLDKLPIYGLFDQLKVNRIYE